MIYLLGLFLGFIIGDKLGAAIGKQIGFCHEDQRIIGLVCAVCLETIVGLLIFIGLLIFRG